MKIPADIISFLKKQSYVIFSTVDKEGRPHSVAKGIVDIDDEGTIFLLDLYRGRTYENLQRNANASITAVDEHEYVGYTLKGKASIVDGEGLDEAMKEKWRRRLRARISQRMIRNIQSEISGNRPHEAHLPEPEYIITFKVAEIVDLSHGHGAGR